MPHWTYTNDPPSGDLAQGDILIHSPELLDVLKKFHPYFSDSKYLGFLVVSQSCDMVARDGNIKTNYISLAVIRSLRVVLKDIVESIAGSGFPDIYKQERRSAVAESLKKIANQNEQSQGLYYLHPHAEVGLSEPSVAMLRVTIALRSTHIEILKNCRRGRLTPEFTAKLGWLTGNLYSRVGTRDWSDEIGDEAFRKWIDDLIQENVTARWLPENQIRRAQKASLNPSGLTLDQIETQILSNAPETPKAIAIQRVKHLVQQLIDESMIAEKFPLEKLLTRLANDATFSATVKKG